MEHHLELYGNSRCRKLPLERAEKTAYIEKLLKDSGKAVLLLHFLHELLLALLVPKLIRGGG